MCRKALNLLASAPILIVSTPIQVCRKALNLLASAPGDNLMDLNALVPEGPQFAGVRTCFRVTGWVNSIFKPSVGANLADQVAFLGRW